ncbi:MAG: Ig-like domain-containing protein [Myxococcales bacterium]|nr:Ig-like domain-containing protein [Myxococcales bacterium]
MRHLPVVLLSLALALSPIFGCSSETSSSSEDAAVKTDGGTDGGTTADGETEADSAATQDIATPDSTATTPDAAAGDAGSDGGTDGGATPDANIDPCTATTGGLKKTIGIPLGETLHFSGDDYLAFWGKDRPCAVQLVDKPKGAQAGLLGGGTRLTPDVAGNWQIQSGADVITITVIENYWNADTFQNFNYSPTSPIAVQMTGKAKSVIWIAAPTSCLVQQVDLTDAGAKIVKTVRTGAWPTAVAVWPGTDFLLVTQTARDSIGFLNTKTGVLEDAVLVGNEPANIVLEKTDGKPPKFAYVALSGEDKVAKLDLQSRQIVATVSVGRDPRAMTLVGQTLYVASLISSNTHPRGPKQLKDKKTGEKHPVPEFMQRDVAAIDTTTMKVSGWAREVGTILRGVFMQPAQGKVASRLLVAATFADNTKLMVDANTRPHAHHLVALDPDKFSLKAPGKAESAVVTDIDLDKQIHGAGAAASPYTMATTPDGNYLVVSLSASRGLLFLDPKTLAERGRIKTGHDPRGLVFAQGRVWTYAWLSDTLEGVPLPGAPTEVEVNAGGLGGGKGGKTKIKIWKMGPLGPAKPVKLTIGNDPTPKEVRAGQRIFNDAEFSKFGQFSCNNCHVDGLTDGLTWDLLIDGPVNTLAFRNVGGTDPFLWGGQLPTLFDFSREVLKLVGAQASGKQMEQLTQYMMSVTAPPNPFALPGGKLTADAKKGKVLFNEFTSKGGGECAGCHGGPLGTTGITVDGKTPDEKTDVPSLLGVYDTAPYGRQGQWATLSEMVDYALEFTGAKLSDSERKQVTAFVAQLPGDLLTLNSATPANNAKYVWKGTAVELIFSHVMAPGQEDKFTIVTGQGSKAKPLPGSWKLSGRYARFTPTSPLTANTVYGITVAAGLQGTFGQHLPSQLVLGFETGGTPAFDVSGQWKLTLQNQLVGKIGVDIALLMAKGGKFTGVLLDKFEEGNVGADAVAGVVSDKVLVLEPFYVDSQFGKFFVKDGIKSNMTDGNKDGYADAGVGSFDFKFGNTVYKVNVTWKRTALPKTTAP